MLSVGEEAQKQRLYQLPDVQYDLVVHGKPS